MGKEEHRDRMWNTYRNVPENVKKVYIGIIIGMVIGLAIIGLALWLTINFKSSIGQLLLAFGGLTVIVYGWGLFASKRYFSSLKFKICCKS